MLERAERLRLLLQKRMEEELTFEEQRELDSYFDEYLDERKLELFKKSYSKSKLADLLKEYRNIRSEADKISIPVIPAKVYTIPGRKTRWFRWVAAASVILVVYFVSHFLFVGKKNAVQNVAKTTGQPAYNIKPGTYGAILKLADGTQIVLDSAGSGLLAQQGNASVVNEDGKVKYKLLSGDATGLMYNTLKTSAGQSYSLMLSDGTKVWLNACSSLYFPTVFTGNTREVVLTGEAYFEIAKNKEKPFHVNVDDMQVEVLGTHFNVNAYAEENAIKTSLLEGKVRIIKGSLSDLLSPGQQAVVGRNVIQTGGYRIVKRNVDMSEVIAWKNGLFQFNEADITTIMRQIGRWYNVEIAYAGKVPDRRFEGKISRDAELSDVLKILELSNVKFTVEGKKIIVQ